MKQGKVISGFISLFFIGCLIFLSLIVGGSMLLGGCGGGESGSSGSTGGGSGGSSGGSGSITEEEREAAMDAVEAKFQALTGLDIETQNQQLKEYMSTLPAFKEVGIIEDCVWSRFTDDRQYVFANNYLNLGSFAVANPKSKSSDSEIKEPKNEASRAYNEAKSSNSKKREPRDTTFEMASSSKAYVFGVLKHLFLRTLSQKSLRF